MHIFPPAKDLWVRSSYAFFCSAGAREILGTNGSTDCCFTLDRSRLSLASRRHSMFCAPRDFAASPWLLANATSAMFARFLSCSPISPKSSYAPRSAPFAMHRSRVATSLANDGKLLLIPLFRPAKTIVLCRSLKLCAWGRPWFPRRLLGRTASVQRAIAAAANLISAK